jgi:hypothetical protein
MEEHVKIHGIVQQKSSQAGIAATSKASSCDGTCCTAVWQRRLKIVKHPVPKRCVTLKYMHCSAVRVRTRVRKAQSGKSRRTDMRNSLLVALSSWIVGHCSSSLIGSHLVAHTAILDLRRRSSTFRRRIRIRMSALRHNHKPMVHLDAVMAAICRGSGIEDSARTLNFSACIAPAVVIWR